MTERNSIVEIGQKYSTPRNRRRGSGDLEYVYDKVFEEQTNTCQIYSDIVTDMVHSVTKEGRNGTVFAYGQTSSGKTFTMQGCDDSDSTGIIQLAANDIFRYIKEENDANTHSEYSVRVSYVEIYNEELRDLLTDNKRKSSTTLVIREDKRGSISVEGLKEIAVNSLEQLMEVFRVGEANKSVGSTKMNDRSSRSHAILKIILERKTVLNPSDLEQGKENTTDTNASALIVNKTISSLNLVDLAGSESVRHTGATGQQKKEGGMINQR
jgi:centromeric protein E